MQRDCLHGTAATREEGRGREREKERERVVGSSSLAMRPDFKQVSVVGLGHAVCLWYFARILPHVKCRRSRTNVDALDAIHSFITFYSPWGPHRP